MFGGKKGSKLSRGQGQQKTSHKVDGTNAPLDDSMDDFIVTRPLRAERKSSKVREAGTSKLVQIEADTGSASSSYQLSEDDGVNDSPRTPASSKLATVSVFLCPLCGRSFKNPEQKDRHVAKCAQSKNVNEKTLLAAEELQKRQIAERLSLGLPPCNVMKSAERRPRRCGNREIDPSDLSLAIAMSESLQSASEDARRKEEELLITENLAEVIPDLRQEEIVPGNLASVFQKPEEAPLPSKVKRKPRAVGPKNKLPTEYTLSLRSQAERERLIADRAATILMQHPVDPLQPAKTSFVHDKPVSEYVKEHSQSDAQLWQRASLSNTTDDLFYVPALRSVVSPAKKKAGYTNILLHASQLPGRNSSQAVINASSMMSTQAILEELALGADGGFMDDSKTEEGPTDAHPSTTKLADDWSHFIDNPLLSDVTILVGDGKKIHAHRLVLAARCPNILDSLDEKTGKTAKLTIDWTDFPAPSVFKVLRYVYSARYEYEAEDAQHIYHLARRYRLTELLDLLRQHNQCSFISDDGCEAEEKESESESNASDVDIGQNNSAKASAVDMDISSSVTTSTSVPLPPASPDMFAESINVPDSDDESPPAVTAVSPSSRVDVIDLTQEEAPLPSPQLGSHNSSVEDVTEKADEEHFDGDVSMLDESRVQQHISPVKDSSPPAIASSLASCSRVNPSFTNDSFASFNDYDGGGCSRWNAYSSPALLPNRTLDESDLPAPEPVTSPSPQIGQDNDVFPDELDPVFAFDVDGPSTSSCSVGVKGIRPISPRLDDDVQQMINTPEAPRLAKKRKIEVTPLPDYQTMDTPGLKKELDKYGLKPLKRKNAVKLLHHIYEELHPLVTDSESSFQDTPERRLPPRPTTQVSPAKSQDSSQASQSGDSSNVEDEESALLEMDRELGSTQHKSTIPLKDQMKDFFKKRPEIYRRVLTYEPIPFEYLYKEVRKEGIRCKAVELLDWLDEECITCRMKNRNRNRADEEEAISSPDKVATTKSPAKGRRIVKKLIA